MTLSPVIDPAVADRQESVAPVSGPLTRDALVRAVVESIHAAPFQARYLKKGHGPAVQGWHARLEGYFWPNPNVDRAATSARLSRIQEKLAPLVHARAEGRDWTSEQASQAAQLTEEIFRWGGVLKSVAHITPERVQQVIDSALHGERVGEAPMNSAWTKLASFASACAPADRHQAIWDSRVSHALLRRLDACAGKQLVQHLFPALGWVPGQGGSRIGTPDYAARWRRGYGRWDSHFEGSQVIREMVDLLNREPDRFGGGSGHVWSVRDVEMVLFMDGY